ncbi:esterase family protein [Pedobacter sp. MC2016-14]|uniref:alpha/beta hydrolase n=1 Tax=Pedobacter sp. MC2016-14 TaxID=2897327 RepID=UPI001E45B25B|nr:alpha/beta hydrolase family protein [Pedobacter sp. MC2016-14]MCD0489296.1 esterase family protein [Pedobacter sp. MC2016-14]
MLKLILSQLFLIVLLTINTEAATVDTAVTYSASMKKNIKAIVILPEGYKNGKTYPVVYLLHGAGGRYDSWVKAVPGLKGYVDQYNIIVVCPDGNVTSWYVDSPIDPEWKYETYVATELVNYIDKNYKTLKDRKGRAITGLSMGGHGGLSLSFKHQDIFGAGGSMSGGVDITPFPANWDIAKRLGAYTENVEVWKQNSVVNMVDKLTPKSLALIIDCGKDDFFYAVNMKLHEELLYQNIPHDFTIRPGGHTWDYWRNAIGYQMLYFHDFFSRP